jgi:hypothetical protein
MFDFLHVRAQETTVKKTLRIAILNPVEMASIVGLAVTYSPKPT